MEVEVELVRERGRSSGSGGKSNSNVRRKFVVVNLRIDLLHVLPFSD